jgi:hypothetical protein
MSHAAFRSVKMEIDENDPALGCQISLADASRPRAARKRNGLTRISLARNCAVISFGQKPLDRKFFEEDRMKKKIQTEDSAPTVGEPVAHALSRPISRRTLLKGALASAPFLISPTLLLPSKAHAKKDFGPSTTTEAYMIPNIPGVETVAILTVGDSIGGYRLVGIPDGLGAYHSHGHEFTVVMNHEIAGTLGAVRKHENLSRSSRVKISFSRPRTSTTGTPLPTPTCEELPRGRVSVPAIWQKKALSISTTGEPRSAST